jgi:hypothetical protein
MKTMKKNFNVFMPQGKNKNTDDLRQLATNKLPILLAFLSISFTTKTVE